MPSVRICRGEFWDEREWSHKPCVRAVRFRSVPQIG
nr:MAG TPA: hypothetical protein [Bacteriophage sp.]